jgi:ATP-dependent DNA helicase RecG
MLENSEFDKKSLKLVTGKSKNWNELAKDCVSFANSLGGKILIGIEDKEEEPDKNQRISSKIVEEINKTIPQRTISVAINASKKTSSNGGEFIEIKVFRSAQAIASTTDGRYYIRVADQCKPIMPDELTRIAAEKQAFVWEEKIARKVSIDNADSEKLNKFLEDIQFSDRVSPFVKQMTYEELLEFYFFSRDGYLTNLGILWIGKRKDRANIYFPLSIQFIKYDENDNKINKLIWDDFNLNPKELFNEIISLSEWKESIEISDGIFRKNIPNYNLEIIRELIANALVHRMYTMKGDIFINLYYDRLEIHSPGLLPLGVTPQNIISKSVYRNTHLSKVFYDLQLMEKEGSGYDKVYEVLLFNGKPEPIVEEWDDRVVVTVKKHIINKEVVRLMSKVNDDYFLNQKEIIALGLITQNGTISSLELISKLSLRNNASLKYWIKKLVEKDIILTKGRTKATEYFINPELLRLVDFKGKTDLKKIEPHRLEHLILEDLKIYKKTSIGDLHKRIGVEINQKKIKRQLDKMIDDNKIKTEGENRWRRYSIKKQ